MRSVLGDGGVWLSDWGCWVVVPCVMVRLNGAFGFER